MTRGWRAGVEATCIVVLLFALASPATAQLQDDKPIASIKKGDWAVGEKIFVEGNNWPRGNVTVQVCGNGGANGTPDCDMPGSRNYGVSSQQGQFRGNVIVALPPAPCPCVVVVRSLTSSAQFSIPITIDGAPAGNGLPKALPTAPQTTIKIATVITGGPLWRDAFGLQPSRSLRITITNSGTRATGAGSVDVTFGKSKSPTGFGETVPFASIDPGKQATVQTEFPLDPISLGDYHIRVAVDAAYAHGEQVHTVSIYPWALGVVVIVIIVLLDILLIRRVWRNRRRRNEPPLDDELEAPASPMDDAVVDPFQELIDLSEPVEVEPVLAMAGASMAIGAADVAPLSPLAAWAPPVPLAPEPLHTNGHVVAAVRTVTFTLPGFDAAMSVAVCGDFNAWAPGTPMNYRNHGWTVKIDLDPGQAYHYRFLVDGHQWEDDPLAFERVPNDFGSEDCVIRT